jgi:hypothetical protein
MQDNMAAWSNQQTRPVLEQVQSIGLALVQNQPES